MSRPRRAILLLSAAAIVIAAVFLPGACSVVMPGDSYSGPLPLITDPQRSLAECLRADVESLAGRIGERNVPHPDGLRSAEDFLAASLARAGYAVRWQTFDTDGVACSNLEAQITGTLSPDQIVIIGAHYDSARGTPGANDNASGCAAVLALARAFAGAPTDRTLRFVLFANEEPPYFWSDHMGSLVYARSAKRRGDTIVAMLSLETIGYYSDASDSQDYPPPFSLVYPDEGNFIAFVGMHESKALIEECTAAFRASCRFPCEGAALPGLVPRVGSSDHWAFWKQGYPALMVTDTARYRYPHYHKPTDTPDKLDYERMARVVGGLEAVIRQLAVAQTGP